MAESVIKIDLLDKACFVDDARERYCIVFSFIVNNIVVR